MNEEWLLEKVLEYLPQYKKIGHNYNFRCPYCLDSKKSKLKMRGWYYPKTASFYCWNCDHSDSALGLIKRMSGENYYQIKREYIRNAFKHESSRITQDTHSKEYNNILEEYKNASSIIPDDWKQPLTVSARNYLDKRFIFDAPFINDMRFYSCYNKKLQEFILIPWPFNGVDIYYQINDYLKHSEIKYIFPYNHNKIIFGLDNIDISFKYIICFEGVYDSLFVKNGIAIGGKNLTSRQYEIIKARYPYHKIVFSLDNDAAGKAAALKLIESNSNSLFFNWFKKYNGHKDINDLIININKTDLFVDNESIENLIESSLSTKLYLKGFKL